MKQAALNGLFLKRQYPQRNIDIDPACLMPQQYYSMTTSEVRYIRKARQQPFLLGRFKQMWDVINGDQHNSINVCCETWFTQQAGSDTANNDAFFLKASKQPLNSCQRLN